MKPDLSSNPRRLSVVHVTLGLNMGGMEKLLVEFAKHTDRERFLPRFVSLTDRGSLAAEIEANGAEVFTLDTPPGLRPGLVLRLARLFRRLGADIVHTHNTKPLIYASPAARLANVSALVHTRHGQRFGASARSNLAFRLAALGADRIVSISADSARLSVREGIAPAKVCTILNGIDVSRFAYSGPNLGGAAVMVGRQSPEKDVATLIRAADLVAKKRPGFRLEIAGDGAARAGSEALTRELGLEGCVRFLGEVREIPQLLARSRLFVLPSLTEGISLTLLEAMAIGLPIVATRVGGNPEVVDDGVTGWLVPPGEPAQLAEKMLRLLDDDAETLRMGAAARARAIEVFDIRTMIAHYENLYLQLLDRHRGHPARRGLGDAVPSRGDVK